MRKSIKSIALSGATLLTSFVPISIAVSCGANSEDPNKLTFSIRAEDANAWKEIFNKFKNKTGIEVKVRLVSDQKQEYSTWEGTDSLPDIMTMDQNTAKYALQNNLWAQMIDLSKLSDKKYDLSKLTKEEYKSMDENANISLKQSELDFMDNNVYMSSILNSFKKVSSSAKTIALPYGYGAQGIFLNKNNLDLSKNLKAYIPKKDGSFQSFEITKNGTTMQQVKDFIYNSGQLNSNDKKIGPIKDDDIIKNNFSDGLKWYDNGPLAMYQRLASISKSLGNDSKPGWIKDISFPFELIASIDKDIFDGKSLNDDNLQIKFPKSGIIQDKYFEPLYQSYYGYFKNSSNDGSFASNPKKLKSPGEADAFWEGKGNIMLGYKWMSSMIGDNYYVKKTSAKEKNYNDSVEVVSSPYGSIGVDTLAIREGISGEKLESIYKLLRFIFEEENAYNATLQKTMSPLISAKIKQKNTINNDSNMLPEEKNRQLSFFQSSMGEKYLNISGGIAASSTDGIYDVFNGKYGGDDGLKSSLTSSKPPTNYKEWKSKAESILSKVYDEIELRG